jgi:hypothetical protein
MKIATRKSAFGEGTFQRSSLCGMQVWIGAAICTVAVAAASLCAGCSRTQDETEKPGVKPVVTATAGFAAKRGEAHTPSGNAARSAASNTANVVFVLFDLSASTSDPAIRERYARGFDTILEQVEDTRLMGDVITANSLATASYPINATFPAYSQWTDNPLTFKRKLKKEKEVVRRQVNKLLKTSRREPHTDLMNAFQLAAKVFNSEECANSQHKVLVVFSDMTEQSKSYNFVRLKLAPKEIEKIIMKERQAGQLPDLRGVKVYVAGAGAAPTVSSCCTASACMAASISSFHKNRPGLPCGSTT